jgi:hypothetical protein
VGSFFQELAKKLAQQWVSLLLLPGALFAAATWVGLHLGHRHALDRVRLDQAAADTAAMFTGLPAATQVILVGGILLAATGIGLTVQALAGLTRRIWLGTWPRLFAPFQRWLVQSRHIRWHNRLAKRRQLEQTHPPESRTAKQQQLINFAADRTNKLALSEPGRPTWMGDRIHAVEQIALNRAGLDLTFVWPRLWLVLPDTTRAEINAAQAAFAAAVATGTWAWPYILLAPLWWPAALIAVGIGTAGWARARAAITDMTALSEAAVDLHARALAISLGVAAPDTHGPLTISEGEKVTTLSRKGR